MLRHLRNYRFIIIIIIIFKDIKRAKIKSLERLEVLIITINEAVVQKNCVKTLYRHGKPLEEKLALSDLAGGHTNSASQLRQEINSRVIAVSYTHLTLPTIYSV